MSSRLTQPVALRGLPSWAAGRLALLTWSRVVGSVVVCVTAASLRVPLFNEKCDRSDRQYFRQNPILVFSAVSQATGEGLYV